jgi:tetratricopeptide (TPR) repeat protein
LTIVGVSVVKEGIINLRVIFKKKIVYSKDFGGIKTPGVCQTPGVFLYHRRGVMKRKGYWTAILLIGVFCSHSWLSAQENYQTFLEKGDEYYQRFDNVKALQEYEKAYELAPKEFEVIQRVTQTYNDIGEDLDSKESKPYYEKSVQYAELLLEKFPDNAETYYLLSMTYGNLALFKGGKGKVKLSRKVKENADKAIELNPNHANAYIVLGIYYREVANLNWFLKNFAKAFFGGLPDGSNEDSEEAFLKAIELEPTDIITYYELGRTYEKMEKKDKAIENYEKVLELPEQDHLNTATKAKAEKRLKKLRKKS